MITKTIVVLAKSIKHGKYCIAGKDIITKEWIRPVSDVTGAELSEQQCKCTNEHWQSQGKSPYSSSVFKKVEIDFIQYAPLINQPENYLISNNVWRHKYSINVCEIQQYLDDPESLWGNGDKIDYSFIVNGLFCIQQSLYLVRVDNLKLYKNEEGKRKASFLYKGNNYNLPVTCLRFDEIINNNQKISNLLCISLGENFNGHCYKIVAAIY